MISSSEFSDHKPNAESENCPSCNGPLSIRAAHPYPVFLQIVFALSFVGFLFFYDQIRTTPTVAWAWSGVQIALGIFLIRRRLAAKKRILRCVRCGAAVR